MIDSRGILKVILALAAFAGGMANAAGETYSFGVLSQRSAVLTAQYWNPILEYVHRKAGVQLTLKLARSGPESNDATERGDLYLVSSMKLGLLNTVWLCATCNTCYARCPRGLDLPKIMEAIRQVRLRDNVNHVEPNAISKEELRRLPQIALVSCFRKHTS